MRRLLMLTLLLAGGNALARPAVLVTAPVEGTEFIDNLEAAGRKQVEISLATSLAALSGQHFPVIDWKTAVTPPEAELTLALTEMPGAGDLTDVKLVWRGKVGAGAKVALPNLRAIAIYDSFDPSRETHDPVVLAKVLDAKLKAWFAESSNRADFSRAFVNLVPILRNVASQGEQILLPFSMRAEKIDRLSKLVVHFVANDAGAPHEGVIAVSDLSETQANARTQTLAAVSRFSFGSTAPVAGWSPKISTLLQGSAQSFVLFDDYIFCEAGINGLAVTP